MASLHNDYEYDIFISYRQNDNKSDGWVTEFVEKLNQELSATIKDKLSIFFDENPQDGLLETHQVDDSISSKLKTIIFIPIISQTYCDTSSFAWQHEFIAFRNLADNDCLKRNIRLPNGNYASRILPVKIHDIDMDDVRLLEKELSGGLRSVDFIYRDSGVNRPLRPVDDNLADTTSPVLYRNQINKVANAIKELIGGIKMGQVGTQTEIENVSITSPPDTSGPKISTSLPGQPKVATLSQEKISIFLAWTSFDLKEKREEMSIILQKAGFNVLPTIDCPSDDENFKTKVLADIKKCSCSLHIISNEYGRRFEADDEVSYPRFQFEEAKKLTQQAEISFNCFIWYTPDVNKPNKPAQDEFIKYVRNNITSNMAFSNSLGPMQLVDDIRIITMKTVEKVLDVKDTDIFFIFNQQDEQEAMVITDRISTEYPVELMNILPDGEEEYREKSTQQIPRSKLAVIYFKYSADWALPFIKQVWKQVGGASSPTPLMLVGEDEPQSNMARYFKAPKVVSSIVPKDEVPGEVKKVYVKVMNIE
ncbi:MAG: DUF4062 domain-containing protein [Bacteroidota bacterium]